MFKGTIMFFSSDGTQAHIWSNDAKNPLYLAYSQDFCELWPRLSVGAVVEIDGYTGDAVQRVTKMALVTAKAV